MKYSKDPKGKKGKRRAMKQKKNDSESVYSDSSVSDGEPAYSSKQHNSRKRKSLGQVEVLENAYYANRSWDKKKVRELAKMLDLTPIQVYKWRWDFKKRLKESEMDLSIRPFRSNESLSPDRVEWVIFQIYNQYKLVCNDENTVFSPSGFLVESCP